MAESFVQVPPDSTGKLIDIWVTAGLGYGRQGIVIADPDTDANVVAISSRLRLPIETEFRADYDTGGGTANLSFIGIALPASGGPVAGGTAANPLAVTAASLPLPSGAATLAEQQSQTAVLGAITGAAVITDANGTIQQYLRGLIKLAISATGFLISGPIAHDDPVSTTNPVTIGGAAKSPDGTTSGAVAENDVTRFYGDLNGRQFVNPVSPWSWSDNFNGIADYTDEVVLAAQGANTQIVVTYISCSKEGSAAFEFIVHDEDDNIIFGPIFLEAVSGRTFVSGPINCKLPVNKGLEFTSDGGDAQSFHFEGYVQNV